MIKSRTEIALMRETLLAWYDSEGRSLPWRIRPEDRERGQVPDPYAIWLSEIMLQQTTVPHGTPYWEKFLREFPTVIDLANAERDRVLSLWAGLGYYARARNLHKCAQIVRDDYAGRFPETEAELLKLPGIGLYTAATIAAICFNESTNIVDGNVERVISRIFTVEEPLPKGRSKLRLLAAELASPDRPGDYGQALMDLGAVMCMPRSPNCANCPWLSHCAAYKAGNQTDYPKKTPKKKLPVRYGVVFIARANERVLLETRPDKGLLGGMLGLPGSAWENELPKDLLKTAPLQADWQKLSQDVKHVFTHFELRLTVFQAEVKQTHSNRIWADTDTLKGLPTVFKKALRLAHP